MHLARLLTLVLIALVAPTSAQGRSNKDWSHHLGKLPFVVGHEAGLAKARDEGKPLMLFITTTWCGWCKKLAADSFSDAGVVEALAPFVPVIVDGDVEKDVLKRFGIGGFPDVRFLTADGEQLGHVAGYVPKDEFRAAIAAALQRLEPPAQAVIHDEPGSARGLPVGAAVPRAMLRTAAGEPLALHDALGGKPAVLVFYRGGWCPFCTRHLAELQAIEAELAQLGCRILAISPDPPAAASETATQSGLGYTLLSDAGNEAARQFGLAFRLDDATVQKYKGAGLDLQAQGWTLPVPAAFVIDGSGKVAFAHVDPDYKARIDGAALLEAVRAALPPGEVARDPK